MKRHTYLLILAIFLISGCAQKKGEERVVAAINDYQMTVEDFNYESKEMFNTVKALGETPLCENEVLDALIVKEILIQEAVKEGLDKEKTFMKSIELYWEQTLLKNLLEKKSKEIAAKTVVYDNDIIRYYEKMKNKIRARAIIFVDEKAAQKGMKASDETLSLWENEPQKYAIVCSVPSKLYTLGEDGSLLEYAVFNADINKARGVAQVDGKWTLIIIEEVIPDEIGSPSSLKDEIRERILEIKEKEAMEEWIDLLHSKSRIKINEKVLESLN